MFIQYLAEQGHNMAKLDRKPRRNVQYKDLCKRTLARSLARTTNPRITVILLTKLPAAAVIAKDNLEFLDDTIPKTQPYKEIKHKAAETRAKLQGGKPAGDHADEAGQPNGKKQKSINGFGVHDVVKRAEDEERTPAGPGDGDVHMTG